MPAATKTSTANGWKGLSLIKSEMNTMKASYRCKASPSAKLSRVAIAMGGGGVRDRGK